MPQIKSVVSISFLVITFFSSSVIYAGSFPDFSTEGGSAFGGDNSGEGDWADGYYRTISITNTSGVITYYQIAITPFVDKSFIDNTDLVGSWHFSETSENTITDASDYHNTLINMGATIAKGKFGNAAGFDGTKKQYLYGTHISAYESATPAIEAWIKPNAIKSSPILIYVNIQGAGHDGRGYYLALNEDKAMFAIGDRSGNFKHVKGNTTLKIDTWYYIVGLYDGKTLKVYIDGVEDGANNIGAAKIAYEPNQSEGPTPSTFYIGSGHNANKSGPADVTDIFNSFNGLIDEVRIYNRALSAEEIKTRYDYYTTKIRADYADIRFTDRDGKTELPYWQETDNKFWVKVPQLPIGDSQLYMYYGNISATSVSNGNKTFIFFDDFTSGFDKAKWETNNDASNGGCGAFVRGGIMNIYSGDGNAPGWLHSKRDLPNKITVESTWKVHRNNDYALGGLWISNADFSILLTGVVYNYYTYDDTTPLGAHAFKNQNSFYLNLMSEKTAQLKPYWHDIWFRQSLSYDGTSSADNARYARSKANESWESIKDTAPMTTTNLRLVAAPWAWNSAPNHLFFCDWIAVRRHLSPEPAVGGPQNELKPKNYVSLYSTVELVNKNWVGEDEKRIHIKLELKFVPLAKSNQTSARWKRLRIDKYISPDGVGSPKSDAEISVWLEANNNNQFDDKDKMIAKGSFESNTVLWLDMNKLKIAAEPKIFYLAYGTYRQSTCGLEIKDTAYLEFEENDIWVRYDKNTSFSKISALDISCPPDKDRALETALKHETEAADYKSWSIYYDLVSQTVEEDRDNLTWRVILYYHRPIARSVLQLDIKGKALITETDLIRMIILPHPLKPEIENLIKLLGDDDWENREQATQKLISIGRPAIGLVKEALASSDPEVKMRAKLILDSIR